MLTYHLGWVTTVSPYDTVEHSPPQSHARPYNALWAQLSDLCGSIGFPPRAARTILSGEKNQQFINRLLLVLTYFVRCGDVTRSVFKYQDCVIKEVKTVSVKKQSGCGLKKIATHNKLDCAPVNTQNSDSSDNTLIASQVSFKRSTTLANLSQKLSNSSEVGSSSASVLGRKPTMMHSMKSSSDSSLNSNASDEPVPEKVLFVLGDDEKLVGLKNKSNGGKMVKKSSKLQNEPVKVEQQTECVKASCDKTKNPDSPSKCCGQTLQHSKPIKHSGFKFEFDKYPQIVTNYMKSKNLEILDRHYIGKPGNLKLDNFQFDPTIVPAIQEERCETCVKCQMESMLQTPTNASEMEYMNDMPRALEPQFANEKVVTEMDNKREMSPKTFVRKRKENAVVVNLVRNIKSVSDGEVNRSEANLESDRICTNVLCNKGIPMIPIVRTPQNSTVDTNPLDSADAFKTSVVIVRPKRSYFNSTSKLKATKSLGNLNLLISEADADELDTTPISKSDWKISSNETLHISSTDVKSTFLNEIKTTNSSNDFKCVSAIKSIISSNESISPVSLDENEAITISSYKLDSTFSCETNDSIPKTSPIEEKIFLSDGSISPVDDPTLISSKSSSSPVQVTISSNEDKSTSKTSPKAMKPTLLELKMPEARRTSRDIYKTVEVKRVIEFPLPSICSSVDNSQRSGFDGSLLGGLTNHYVPDLILQGELRIFCLQISKTTTPPRYVYL